MSRDAKAGRGDRPFIFTNLKSGQCVEDVIQWIERELLFDRS
jgi:urease accessory protein